MTITSPQGKLYGIIYIRGVRNHLQEGALAPNICCSRGLLSQSTCGTQIEVLRETEPVIYFVLLKISMVQSLLLPTVVCDCKGLLYLSALVSLSLKQEQRSFDGHFQWNCEGVSLLEPP